MIVDDDSDGLQMFLSAAILTPIITLAIWNLMHMAC